MTIYRDKRTIFSSASGTRGFTDLKEFSDTERSFQLNGARYLIPRKTNGFYECYLASSVPVGCDTGFSASVFGCPACGPCSEWHLHSHSVRAIGDYGVGRTDPSTCSGGGSRYSALRIENKNSARGTVFRRICSRRYRGEDSGKTPGHLHA